MDHIPSSIGLEISNRCNYAKWHKDCPVDPGVDPVFLSTAIIEDVAKYLGSIKWQGSLYLNVFNEPMIDPRLFMLVELIKKHCKTCTVQFYTNGWSLNQYMVTELTKIGVEMIFVSVYSDSEWQRFSKINGVVASRVELNKDVMTIYDQPPTCTGPCLFPSVYSMVNCYGEFVLCCRDYKYRHVLGDLNGASFDEILASDKRMEWCDRLASGDRFLDTCKRCSFPGWGVVK